MARSGNRNGFLWVACAAGLVHAAFSLYWAVGGRWLLDTVGQWAVDLADRAPLTTGLALMAVVAVKVAGASVPLLVESGRLPWRRFWRIVSAIGAGVIVVYGGLNTVIAWAVLAGQVEVSGGYDRTAMLGHAALWDPLFLIWGAFLGVGLWQTRGPLSAGSATQPG